MFDFFRRRGIRKMQDMLFKAVVLRFEAESLIETNALILPIALHLTPSHINLLRHAGEMLRGKEEEESEVLHRITTLFIRDFISGMVHNWIFGTKSVEELSKLSSVLNEVLDRKI